MHVLLNSLPPPIDYCPILFTKINFMTILLAGANGYIGKRLLPILIKAGHRVVCCVRDLDRFSPVASIRPFIEVVEVDFLDEASLHNF